MAEHVKFLFNTEWMVNIRKLKDREKQLDLFYAIVDYAETRTHAELPFESDLVIEPIKSEIERYQSNYKQKCETNKQIALTREQRKREEAEELARLRTLYDEESGEHERVRTWTNVDERKRPSPPKPNPEPNPNPNPDVSNETVKKNKSKEKTKFVRDNPPTREEVEAYAKEKGYVLNVDKFLGYYGSQGWKKKNGQLATSWRGLVATCAERHDLLEERKRNLVQDETRLGGINRWMIEYTPFLVGFMEHLFTAEEIEWLCEKYGSAKIAKVLEILEDRKEYTRKHTNLYLTVKEWIDKEPPSDTPSEPQPQSEQDDYFAWLPQGASTLYRDFYIHLCECNKYFFEKVKDVLPTQEQFQSLVDDYGYDIVEYVSGTRTSLTDQSPTLYDLLADLCPEEKEWREKHGR